MKETQSDNKFFTFLQLFIYLFISLDVYINTIAYKFNNIYTQKLNETLFSLSFIKNPVLSHITVFFMVFLIGVLTRSKKNINYNVNKHFIYPLFFGSFLFVGTFLALLFIPDNGNLRIITYTVPYYLGATALHVAFSNLSKRIPKKLKEDIWNQEEESFMQNQDKIEDTEIFNLPTIFYYKKKLWNGWMNINPFRGTLVIGVPGSGKSASVIIPFIKQFIHKSFTFCIYDYKYPDLTKIAYHHYKLEKATNPNYNYDFNVINLDSLTKSKRCNPIASRYIKTLADANETAEAIILALTKSADAGSGSSQFFTASAINFLSSVIYFLARYKNGEFCTLPHVISMISQPYDKLFTALFTNNELKALLTPYKTAFDNEAFDQLEGQIGTVRINISRLATKQSYWIFSGDDIDFKISQKDNPSILILANDPDTQSVNSAFYASVLLRLTKQINSKHNLPSAIVVDEAPTVYLHGIDNLIATARSNKVAVMLGIQELSQLEKGYGAKTANVITDIMGSIISGAVRNKKTLDWLQELAGKVKQVSTGLSIDRDKTNINMNEKMDHLIPASKISNLNAGELVAVVSSSNSTGYGLYQPNVYNCKIDLNWKEITTEEALYTDSPTFYDFGDDDEMNETLEVNFQNIWTDVEDIVDQFMLEKIELENANKENNEEINNE